MPKCLSAVKNDIFKPHRISKQVFLYLSEPLSNHPFVLHHEQCAWERMQSPSRLQPTLLPSLGKGQMPALCQGNQHLLLPEENRFSLPENPLAIHTATLFVRGERHGSNLTYYHKRPFPFLPPTTSRACLTPITFSAFLF